jgi:asparagine synthase (glutamine-hydrolysing)
MADVDLSELLTEDALNEQEFPYQRHMQIWENVKHLDPLQQALYMDVKTYLPALNCFYTDKTSMGNSVEVRVPFLDLDVAQVSRRMPNELKVDGKQTKVLLKKIAEKYLPSEIIHRKKTGFGLPVRDWLIHDLQPLAQELLSPQRLESQNLFNPKLVDHWLKEHRYRRADHSAKIYLMMTLQLWIDQFEVTL